jgi:hypothetical protein
MHAAQGVEVSFGVWANEHVAMARIISRDSFFLFPVVARKQALHEPLLAAINAPNLKVFVADRNCASPCKIGGDDNLPFKFEGASAARLFLEDHKIFEKGTIQGRSRHDNGRVNCRVPGRIVAHGNVPADWRVANLRDSPGRHFKVKSNNPLPRLDF